MTEPTPEPRLRPHPDERFAARHLEIDLNTTAERLRAEHRAVELKTAQRKHRQETLYRHNGLTIALFSFEKDGGLPPHKAAGIVNVHVLRGRLRFTAEDTVYTLAAGQMLVLASGVPHSLVAEEETDMLLTVKLDGA